MPKSNPPASRLSRPLTNTVITLSLPRRILKYFLEEVTAELGLLPHQSADVVRDFIAQYCVALLQNPDEELPMIPRIPHSSAAKYSVYVGCSPPLMRALSKLAAHYGTTPTVIARSAFYAYDMNHSRFKIKLPKQPEPKARREKQIAVLIDHRLDVAVRAKFKAAESKSDIYRTVLREFIESGAPLYPADVLKNAIGVNSIGFVLSDDENDALLRCASRLNTTITNVIRSAFIRAAYDS